MPASKAHIKATNKWMAKAYDRINLTVPKGQKDNIQAHAAAGGESVNGFIGRAILEAIERDGPEDRSEAAQGPSGGGAVSLSPLALNTAQEAAQSAGETVSQFIERAVSVQAQRDKSSLALGINPATGDKLEKEA